MAAATEAAEEEVVVEETSSFTVQVTSDLNKRVRIVKLGGDWWSGLIKGVVIGLSLWSK